jgi:hypothetical protein
MGIQKLLQQYYMKIAVICGRYAQKCHAELHRASRMADRMIPYHMVVTASTGTQSRRVSTADACCSGYSMSLDTDTSVAINERCMDEARCWTVKESAKHIRKCMSKTLQILQQAIKRYKTAATSLK